MFFNRFRRSSAQTCSASPGGKGRRKVARAGATIELLDQRIFLSSSYSAGTNVSFAILSANPNTLYDVDVYENGSGTPTAGSPYSPDLNNQIDIIGHHSGFKLIDQIPAAKKPTGGIKFHIIGFSNGIMEVDATDDDKLMYISASSGTATTVTTSDGTATSSDIAGTGVPNLTLRTNDVVAAHYYGDTGTGAAGSEVDIASAAVTGTSISNLPAPISSLHIEVDTGAGTFDKINLGGDGSLGEFVANAVVVTGAGNDSVYLGDNEDDATSATIDFGAGNGMGNGLGLGNRLDVRHTSVATITQVTTTDPIVVDRIDVEDHATLIISGETVAGEIEVHGGASALIEAPLTVAASGSLSGTFTVDDTGYADLTAESTIDYFNIGGLVYVEATCVVGNLAGTGTVLVRNTDLTLLTSSSIGTLNFEDDAVVILQARAGSPSSSSARILSVHTLDLGSTSSPDGTLDLEDNDLIVDYSSTSPFSSVRSWIIDGWNSGPWTGAGITSSVAGSVAADSGNVHKTALGYGEASVANFQDDSVDSTSVVVKYTYCGDHDLDGLVNSADTSVLFPHWLQTPANWTDCDFNYDNIVSMPDFNAINTNYGQPQL